MFSTQKIIRTFIYAAITYSAGWSLAVYGPSTLSLVALFWSGMAYMTMIHNDANIVRAWVWVKIQIWIRWHQWNLLPCPHCGGSDFSERKEVIEWGWGTMEFEEYCIACKQTTNYWAYGSYEYPKTRTQELHRRWYNVKQRILSWGWFKPNLKKLRKP